MKTPVLGDFAKALCLFLVLSACSSRPPAPVVERSTGPVKAGIPPDGLHRVRTGDSLHAIAFRYGLDYRDIADWNGIRAPYVIYPDQALRLKPPPSRPTASSSGTRAPATTMPAGPEPRSSSRDNTSQVTRKPPASKPPSAARSAQSASTGDPSVWRWPVDGRLLRTFKAGDPSRNGIDIVGSEGQPVHAAAAGTVVYSGSGLIGFGELIIIKHSDRMLSAYAHNRRRLVAEGELISQGQKISELGRNDRNEQILHFEIRVKGTPVNPLNYLPKQVFLHR